MVSQIVKSPITQQQNTMADFLVHEKSFVPWMLPEDKHECI
jgi:hypothetical protein